MHSKDPANDPDEWHDGGYEAVMDRDRGDLLARIAELEQDLADERDRCAMLAQELAEACADADSKAGGAT